MILNKIDLLPHVDFDVERCLGYARRINPAIECLQLSATTGQGLDAWCAWLRRQLASEALAGPDRSAAIRAPAASDGRARY